MQRLKTISGHYDTAYNLAHNNRQFLPRNVDVRRVAWNYYCVAAGQEASLDWEDPRHISEFWKAYKKLNDLYWSERSLLQQETYREYREHMERLRRYSRQMYPISHSFAEALVTILLLPLLLPCGIYLNHEQKQIAKELEKWKEEATPGVHLTCIPYSRNCTRGPKVQAAMGRAFAGMGYPSTWKDAQDSDGNRIPKKNKNGEILHNRDGSIRYQQVPAQQGIIDWIEDQKGWIQSEMKRRYDWDREYKGSHSRGNLSTPDYQAARAKERQEEYERLLQSSLTQYEEKVHTLSLALDDKVDDFFREAETQNMIDHYLTLCSDEEYEAIAKRAAEYLDQLAVRENEKRHGNLIEQIRAAEKQQSTVADGRSLTNHQR